MKIIEDYAQRAADKKAEKTRKKFITKLNKNGLKTKEIAKYLELNEEYVKKIVLNTQLQDHKR